MTVFLNGKYVPRGEAKISVDDRGFLFGDGIYEVIRVYRGRPFQIDAHLKRLRDGLSAMKIQGVDAETFRQVGQRILADNDLSHSDATLYIQITRGAAVRQHAFPPKNVAPTVFVSAAALNPESLLSGSQVTAVLVPDLRWARCDIKSISLVANVLARQQAIEAGVTEAILVRDGVALEGTSSNLFAVVREEVITHPKTNCILPGVTRDVVLKLCAGIGIPYREAPILEQVVHGVQELFVTSTTIEIAPLVELDKRPIGNGKPGPITSQLQQAFRELVTSFLENADPISLNGLSDAPA